MLREKGQIVISMVNEGVSSCALPGSAAARRGRRYVPCLPMLLMLSPAHYQSPSASSLPARQGFPRPRIIPLLVSTVCSLGLCLPEGLRGTGWALEAPDCGPVQILLGLLQGSEGLVLVVAEPVDLGLCFSV